MDNREANVYSLISKLESIGFSKTKDRINAHTNLYFRQIDEGRFLVFRHFYTNRKIASQMFDCWTGNYPAESEIGKTRATQVIDVRIDFQIDRDWDLIAPYL
jgi:hypothetical protein